MNELSLVNEKVVIDGKTYVIKEILQLRSCQDCAMQNKSLIYCVKSVKNKVVKLTKLYNHHCGMNFTLLIEDTPEALTDYLYKKLNKEKVEYD